MAPYLIVVEASFPRSDLHRAFTFPYMISLTLLFVRVDCDSSNLSNSDLPLSFSKLLQNDTDIISLKKVMHPAKTVRLPPAFDIP